MNRSDVKEWIERVGIVPVLRANSMEEASAIADAIVEGGITVLEVTMTVPNPMDLLGELKAQFKGSVLLGSGTVTTAEQCQASIEAGAEFVVSPGFAGSVVATTRELGKVSIPGALTPTEIMTAWNAGADYVKIFPCSALGGANYLKSIKAPFPHMEFIPTGGVNLSNAHEFLRAGARALGVGADLANPKAIAEGRPESITETARAYVSIIERYRLQ